MASTSAAIMYKSIENRHHWQTSRVRVKGSDRRPFVLILDWILVYTSLTIWMKLSSYPNLCKAEKLKSQSTLTILQKIFYSVYLTHHSHKKEHSLKTCARLLFMLLQDLFASVTEWTKFFLPKCLVHYFYHLKPSNIIGHRKITNTEKQFYP